MLGDNLVHLSPLHFLFYSPSFWNCKRSNSSQIDILSGARTAFQAALCYVGGGWGPQQNLASHLRWGEVLPPFSQEKGLEDYALQPLSLLFTINLTKRRNVSSLQNKCYYHLRGRRLWHNKIILSSGCPGVLRWDETSYHLSLGFAHLHPVKNKILEERNHASLLPE